MAQQQGLKPKYGLADDTAVSVYYGSQHPDYDNIAGAIAITASRYGAERTPGMTPSAATARCDAILRSHGRPPLYQQFAGVGALCDQVWLLKAAGEHAGTRARETLAGGMYAAKSVEFSYPLSPNDFGGDRVTHGGQFWLTDEFTAACSCWRVINPVFHPEVPVAAAGDRGWAGVQTYYITRDRTSRHPR